MDSFTSGAIAGLVESTLCHPLDTLKTRIQNLPSTTDGLVGNIRRIYARDGVTGFYRGLGAVYLGVLPKNAVRFATFDTLHHHLSLPAFTAGFLTGATEAIVVVNPTDVIKTRIQGRYHSFMEPLSRSTSLPPSTILDTIRSIWKTEGIAGFYRGMIFTVMRQSINQASNFAVFHWIRKNVSEVPVFLAGGLSGAIGPCLNNPVDVIKTRLQCRRSSNGPPDVSTVVRDIYREHGWRGYWKGLGPRLLRIIPGQGITFTVYEMLSHKKTS